jgi:hypothetical protein
MEEKLKYPQDPFMNREMVKDRLRNEYKKYGQLIIAYDFDYTVHSYRGEDTWSYDFIMTLLREWRPYAKFVVFTASPITRYAYIRTYLDSHNLPYDKINEELFERQRTRKIYYNVFLDDRAGLGETAEILTDLLNEIKDGKLVADEESSKYSKYLS